MLLIYFFNWPVYFMRIVFFLMIINYPNALANQFRVYICTLVSMCVCMCMCMYMYVYMCMYIYVYVYVYVYIYMYICKPYR